MNLSREEFFKALLAMKPTPFYQWGLKTIETLLLEMGPPVYPFPYLSIHVGGTNGKGQVATNMAKSIEFSGYRVGLYTSPHLERYEERIAINGEEITFEDLCKYDDFYLAICEKKGLSPSFFERTTFYAFCHFAMKKVDLVVFEVGIGGRNDATNIISPLLSVITSISKDHMDLLGPTLEDIAFQKSGIIKPNTPVVIGSTAGLFSIFNRAKKCSSPLFIAPYDPFFKTENQQIARTALTVLEKTKKISLTKEAIEKGLAVFPPCRFEKKGKVIFDVAHNLGGFKALVQGLKEEGIDSYQVVLGMCQDKEIDACVREIARKALHIYVVELPSSRSASLSAFEDIFAQIGYQAYSLESSIEKAIEKGLQFSKPLVICGSFYLMRAAKEAFRDVSLIGS